jgi:hypothetical protein
MLISQLSMKNKSHRHVIDKQAFTPSHSIIVHKRKRPFEIKQNLSKFKLNDNPPYHVSKSSSCELYFIIKIENVCIASTSR